MMAKSATDSSIAALATSKLSMCFGGLTAVSELDLEVKTGEIFGIIGPNGAGKTTVFNLLSGVYQPSAGTINAFGSTILGNKPYENTVLGISRTFQNIRLFKELSVLNNILVALDYNQNIKSLGWLDKLFQGTRFLQSEIEKKSRALEILDLFGLSGRSQELSKNLPYGDQRRVEIARALATGAKLILLDEPAAGMTVSEKSSLMDNIRLIRDKMAITVIIIEHDMRVIMGLCEKIAVLDYGRKIAEGSPLEIQNNSLVLEAYLGKEREVAKQ